MKLYFDFQYCNSYLKSICSSAQITLDSNLGCSVILEVYVYLENLYIFMKDQSSKMVMHKVSCIIKGIASLSLHITYTEVTR